MFEKEMQMMREHLKGVSKTQMAAILLLVILTVAVTEFFASMNFYMLQNTLVRSQVLLGLFSILGVLTIMLSTIAQILISGEKDKEFNFYFRTRPLWVLSLTAIIGDIIAVFMTTHASYYYVVFFTSLTAINILAIGFALYCMEKSIEKRH